MWSMESTSSCGFSSVIALCLLCALICGIAFTQDRPMSPGSAGKSGRVVGLAFVSLQVSNLQKSIEYYRALGFTLAGNSNSSWIKDEAENRLYHTPGAMSRTAILKIPTTDSGRPFTLYLREYKDIERGSRADFPARDPSSTHLGLMVPEADALWEKLKQRGLLRPLSWEGKLMRLPGQTSGGIAYVMDPDGLDVEIIGVKPAKPAGTQSASSDRPTLHHLGMAIIDSEKSKAFYGKLLGAEFPRTTPEWLSGDMYDAAVGGRGYVIRLINSTFPEASAPQTPMRFELVEYQKPNRTVIPEYRYSDIAVSCVGMLVDGLDVLYARLIAAGVDIWSEGGIVQLMDGTRSVVVRDPDVNAFVELFEKKAP
ncbi:MAG TPA: VOC family protein [Acidobacteriota bacterium]|nr:VOC family protein [Acidobacteriota bacterium]